MLSSIPGLYPLNDFKDTCPHPPDVPTKIAFSSGPMSPGEKADPVENCCCRVLLRLFKVQTHTQRKHTQMSHVAGFTGGHSPVTLGTIKAPFKAPLAAEFHIPSSWKRRFPLVNPRVFIMFYFVSL